MNKQTAPFRIAIFLSMVGSLTGLTLAQEATPRQQTNLLTSYIDGSAIYGSDPVRAAFLRTFSNGSLKTSEGNLMPINEKKSFIAGDVRVNENTGLMAVQTLFLREHNLIASVITQIFPNLDDETIYQWTRHIVGAELQAITYREFLPALLGPRAIRRYSGYKQSVNAGISNEFATAGYRVGHTLINDDIEFLDNDGKPVREEISLKDAFFNTAPLFEVGPDPVLKYLATDNTQEVDNKIVDGLRNFLFGAPGSGGFDLAARNIQRGRDHGIADYNATRQAYGLKKIKRFSQITSNPEVQLKLELLYRSVDNIDLWVGGLAEDHVGNGSVGPTFRAIMAEQFERTRDGDRFWYEKIFFGPALAAIQKTKLSDIIRRNSTITNLQENVFFFHPDVAEAIRDNNFKSLTVERLVLLAAAPLLSLKNFRSQDGSENNLKNPTWGKAGTSFLRIAPAAYLDGISQPSGADRPGAREISNSLSVETEEETLVRNDRFMADWIYVWGQFLDHDLDLTGTGTESFNIPVPAGDPFFDPQNTGNQFINLNRSK